MSKILIEDDEPNMNDTYILMLTAKSQVFDKQKGKEVGIDFYMTKPFDPDDIIKKAIEVLGIGCVKVI